MVVSLGLVPVNDDSETVESLDRIAAGLAGRLGTPCNVHRAISPAALAVVFDAGAVNLLWSSPTLVLVAPELRSAVPIVTSVRQGVAHYHGVIFVRKDSAIRGVLDLDGTHVGWVAKSSAAGYIFPRVTLAGNGLDPSAMFWKESFLKTHGRVVSSVVEGEVDAGATFAVFEGGDATRPMIRAGFTDLGREDEVRVLLATPPIPADLFVASPALRAQQGVALDKALIAVAEDLPDDVHRVFGADAFIRCVPKQLAELKRQLEDARAMGVLG